MADSDKDSKPESLSRYTLVHVQLIRPRDCTQFLPSCDTKTMNPEGVDKSELLTRSHMKDPSTSEKIGFEVEATTVLSNFALFVKLPVELQDQIWKIFVETTPQLVHFAERYNTPPVLCQINKHLRVNYRTYGYVELKQTTAQTKWGQDFSTIFHPDVDLLYFPDEWKPRHGSRSPPSYRYAGTVIPVLESAGALARMRNIASSSGNLIECHGYLQLLPSLESIFLLSDRLDLKLRLAFQDWWIFGVKVGRFADILSGTQSRATLFECESIKKVSKLYKALRPRKQGQSRQKR